MAAESTFTYHAGKPEPELVYAYKGELERLHAEIERLREALANVASLSHNLAVVIAHVNEQKEP